ncbi:MAG TPA: BREX system ATP-binding domain-containing protein [Acidimicrobiales bacterium]|nr:BREX system ATP-binding domain-containing protein [Acidimicrobiales bacterium]
MTAVRVERRRALEALRAGVPNRDAVMVLGSLQVGVEDRFSQLLDATCALPSGSAPGGILVGGGFGSGKSHVLEHLAHVALGRGFVVSKVVISKETPLHDPAKVYRAAIDEALVPGRPGSAIDEVAAALKPDSPAYAELYRWAHSDDAPLDSRFAATLFLYEYASGDAEFADRIIRFWAGDPLPVADLRRRLKETGAAATYRLASIKERDLSIQRFRFVSRLVRAAGFNGWVVLLDEVELIGRYTVLQRARSYGEIARWVRGDRDDPGAPLSAVLTTVDDFEAQVLVGKNDAELIPKRLRQKGTIEDELAANQAETGMRIIEREQVAIQPPGQDELDRTYAKLKQIHAEAYGWDPPDVPGIERLPSNRMRQYVRAWISEWDLRRLDPTYVPDIAAAAVTVDFTEDADLERPAGDDERAR